MGKRIGLKKKTPKTGAEQVYAYRTRRKLEVAGSKPIKVPKTVAQRIRECRTRKKVIEGEIQEKIPKISSDRSREYRCRIKLRKLENISLKEATGQGEENCECRVGERQLKNQGVFVTFEQRSVNEKDSASSHLKEDKMRKKTGPLTPGLRHLEQELSSDSLNFLQAESGTEKSPNYSERKTIERQTPLKKEPKSVVERSREYRARMRLKRQNSIENRQAEDENISCSSTDNCKDITFESFPTSLTHVTGSELQEQNTSLPRPKTSTERSRKYRARLQLRKQQSWQKSRKSEEMFIKMEQNLDSDREEGHERSISEPSTCIVRTRRPKSAAERSREYMARKKLRSEPKSEDHHEDSSNDEGSFLTECMNVNEVVEESNDAQNRNSEERKTVSRPSAFGIGHQDPELSSDLFVKKDSSSCLHYETVPVEENQPIAIKEEAKSSEELIDENNAVQQQEINIKIELKEYMDFEVEENKNSIALSDSSMVSEEVKVKNKALIYDTVPEPSTSVIGNEDQQDAPDSNDSYCCLYHGPSSVGHEREVTPKKEPTIPGVDKSTQTEEIFEAVNFFNVEEKENSGSSSAQNCNCGTSENINDIKTVTISIDTFPGPSSPKKYYGTSVGGEKPQNREDEIMPKKILYYGTSIGGPDRHKHQQQIKLTKRQQSLQQQQLFLNFPGNKTLYYGTSIGGPQHRQRTSYGTSLGGQKPQHQKRQTKPKKDLKGPTKRKLEYKAMKEALKRLEKTLKEPESVCRNESTEYKLRNRFLRNDPAGRITSKKNLTGKKQSKMDDEQWKRISEPTGEYLEYLTREMLVGSDEERQNETKNSQVELNLDCRELDNNEPQIKTEVTENLDYHFLYDLVKS